MKKLGMIALGGVTAVAAAGITVWVSKMIERSAKVEDIVEEVKETVEDVKDNVGEAVDDTVEDIKEVSKEIKEILGEEESENE